MNIVGPPLGKIAIITNQYPEWNCNQAIVFFRPYIRELSEWIYTFLCEGSFLHSIELVGTAGQDNISVTKSKKIIMPMPPIEEQKRILEKVSGLMSLCERLEKEVNEGKKLGELIVDSTLREAFELQLPSVA